MTWTPGEEPPAENGTYLGVCPESDPEDRVWPVLWEDGKWFDADGMCRLVVTHWMRMPEAPDAT